MNFTLEMIELLYWAKFFAFYFDFVELHCNGATSIRQWWRIERNW